MLSTDESTWVGPNPFAALRFVLAGSMAEVALLGRAIEDGYQGDFAAWRRGVGRTDALTPAELDALAGGSFLGAVHETEAWATANAARILRLADYLAALPAPLFLSYDEVVPLVADFGSA